MNPEEGIIKYNCFWKKENLIDPKILEDIIPVRNKLYEMKLIGVEKNGLCYGNISKRLHQNQFIISASGTGKYEYLSETGYTIVNNFSIEENWVECIGLKQASSESLSHAAIYKKLNFINYVIHVHSSKLWSKYINMLPTTNPNIKYGTMEMAQEISNLIQNNPKNIFIMGGHKDGIISFGENLEQAFASINNLSKTI